MSVVAASRAPSLEMSRAYPSGPTCTIESGVMPRWRAIVSNSDELPLRTIPTATPGVAGCSAVSATTLPPVSLASCCATGASLASVWVNPTGQPAVATVPPKGLRSCGAGTITMAGPAALVVVAHSSRALATRKTRESMLVQCASPCSEAQREHAPSLRV
jgi:hypothetical protein